MKTPMTLTTPTTSLRRKPPPAKSASLRSAPRQAIDLRCSHLPTDTAPSLGDEEVPASYMEGIGRRRSTRCLSLIPSRMSRCMLHAAYFR
eukprot:CAMPEP_0194751750 /NCGR_PEP_ID=MMETSP0323_2-20130528/5715_1 /TAXON_ID=2866 ORGANISM="Crypthecodinium cohnii, Strain Seligo" /NCGR_SAMPLE_ID=MMETSP0323_2 /ASSEMBLY_ACC=CAM_ASM_000346 /LENGTH=89 /DNA_ID=CAMNT_0039668367 /DNA_START=110 /DNA_END=375 /DNA_ORIENTATION=-